MEIKLSITWAGIFANIQEIQRNSGFNRTGVNNLGYAYVSLKLVYEN